MQNFFYSDAYGCIPVPVDSQVSGIRSVTCGTFVARAAKVEDIMKLQKSVSKLSKINVSYRHTAGQKLNTTRL